MEVTYLGDTGCRHEWTCEHGKRDYIVAYHYMQDSWSVQLSRSDGEREILRTEESRGILEAFPMESALTAVQSDIIGPSVWAHFRPGAKR